MANIKTFGNYEDAKKFYGTLGTDQKPEFNYDPEFGNYEVIYW